MQEPASADAAAVKPSRVVIAEDEANIAAALEFLLSRAGYNVQVVTDGEKALDFLRRERPDVMVLDVMLPHVDGFELLKRVRADARLSDLPVLILTAKGQQQDKKTAEAIGATAFMAKPFSNSELVECVKRLKSP